jgi:hypothetical protein
MDSLGDLFVRFTQFFWDLPRGARVATFAFLGLTLTVLAIPRFDEELPMALVYIALAVFFFWMAIAPYM